MEYIGKLQERNQSLWEEVENLKVMKQELDGLATEGGGCLGSTNDRGSLVNSTFG